MDQATASSLAGLHVRDYNKYQIPSSAKIKRKPLAPSHFSSLVTLREEDDEITELRNPLSPISKMSFQSLPDRLGSRSMTESSVGGDETPRKLPAHLIHRLKQNDEERTAIWSDIWEYWRLELLCLFISFCCLVVIVVVLKEYDGTSIADIPMGITLNVFLAFLTTLAIASFMIPVAEAISQWKWNWFKEDRPLSDFQIFDGASRGIIGSFVLLHHLSIKHVASIGAIITILTLFTSPLTQLLIAYPQELMPVDGGTAITQATQMLKDLQANPLVPWQDEVRSAMVNGMASPMNTLVEPMRPNCTTTDCRFPNFRSLAVCTKIGNITQHLNVTVGSGSEAVASLPADANCQLSTKSSFSVVTCKTNGVYSLAFGQDDNLQRATIYSMPIIYYDSGNASLSGSNSTADAPGSFQALEVLFHLCIQEFQVTTEGGRSQTLVTDLPPVIAPSSADQTLDVNCTAPALGAPPAGCRTGGTGLENLYLQLINSTSPSEYFMAELRTLQTLALQLNGATSGLWQWNGLAGDAAEQSAVGAPEVRAVGNALYGAKDLDPAGQMGRVTMVMKNVATSATNAIRSISLNAEDGAEASPELFQGMQVNSMSIQGQALQWATRLQVQWGWLALLASQLVLAAALLAATVAAAHAQGAPVLKGSALGLLFALSDDCRPGAGGLEREPAMRRRARVLQARLHGDAVELSGTMHPSAGRSRSAESSDSRIEKRVETTVVSEKI